MVNACQPNGRAPFYDVQQFSRKVVLSLLATLAVAGLSYCQADTATVSGVITDQSGAVVAGAEVLVTNTDTNVSATATSNDSGVYVVIGLKPGPYRIKVKKEGFNQIDLTDFRLNVQDDISRNFSLRVGSTSESISVEGRAGSIETSGSVSTVINREFVSQLPLNGRSFNTLLQLTPGVVIAPASPLSPGQFSIAGQRTDANNFSVDGVSANFGVASSINLGASGSGSAQAFTVIGGTSSLASVDALEEFRVETSSFAPEFGRAPGGQVVLKTRSGTNDFHGGLFDYFRNDVMDANDWFLNKAGKPRPPERHNDFGGFGGGHIVKNRLFFFLSYEGAQLRLPQPLLVPVPSAYARSVAPSQLAPFIDAYPQPDDRTITPGVFFSPLTGSFSNSATLNAGSIRVDDVLNSRFTIFGRYSDAPSEIAQRCCTFSQINFVTVNSQTVTAGVDMSLGQGLANTVRGNYSTQSSRARMQLDSFGGATPPDPKLFIGSLSSADSGGQFGTFDTAFYTFGPAGRNRTRQMNFADDLSFTKGRHQIKFGGDYRGIFLDADSAPFRDIFFSSSVSAFLSTGTATIIAVGIQPASLLIHSLSAYSQDTWKATSRLSLTYGVRWEWSPAPSARGATKLAAWTNVTDPANFALSSFGTPPWKTRYASFAPRMGLAYALTSKGDFVVRVGGGIFYDIGMGSSANLAAGWPNTEQLTPTTVSMPVTDITPFIPVISLQSPYPSPVIAFSPNLQIPRSYQWNVALEKTFGTRQGISVTYLGQAGRDLLRQEALFKPNSNFSGEVQLTQNDAYSNYNALQLQYRRPLAGRLQALLNYTWSHSLDNASNDVLLGLSNTVVISAANDYASSDFDVRHSFSGALTYSVPVVGHPGPVAAITKDWSIDTVVVARSGFPFNAFLTSTSPDPGGLATSRPDVVPGQPFWIQNSGVGGGKSLNLAAFSVPSTRRQGTEGRNDIPGFGFTQVDLSIARAFSFTERLRLQFRTDAFNVLNHPNFTNPVGRLKSSAINLSSAQMLNNGLGGLNPLFQEGGPRSLQLSLRLSF